MLNAVDDSAILLEWSAGGFVFSNIIAGMSDSLTSEELAAKEHNLKMEKVTSFINVRASVSRIPCDSAQIRSYRTSVK